MQYRWLKQEAHSRIILHFNGWTMTPESVAHLTIPEDCDLLSVWDYREDGLSVDLSSYKHIDLVAWSMGVWAADRFIASLPYRLPIDRAIAFCGTGYPIDDLLGISEEATQKTLASIRDNRARFDRMMCGAKSMRHLLSILKDRSTEEIVGEKLRVYELLSAIEHPLPKPLPYEYWTVVHIGMQDKIIPPENQLRYWQGQGVPIRIHPDAGHYLLGDYSSWSELLDE